MEFCNTLTFMIIWLWRFRRNKKSNSVSCLVGKTAIVTGGNRGIGYATSALLASRGCKVIIACRSDSTEAKIKLIEQTGNPNIETQKLDLSSLRSVRRFAENIRITEKVVDILVNNAGAGAPRKPKTEDGLNELMQTNFFGAFLLTHLLLEPLKESRNARIIFITSGISLFHRVTEDSLKCIESSKSVLSSMRLYANSKFCCILAAQEFAKKLKKYNIRVDAADTGPANTSIYDDTLENTQNWWLRLIFITWKPFFQDTLGAAQTTFHLASTDKLENSSGQVYFQIEPFPKLNILKDQSFCDGIWRRSEELVHLDPEEKI